MSLDRRVVALTTRLTQINALLAKAWTDEARMAALEARRARSGVLPKPVVTVGPVGDKRYRYALSNGHMFDIMDRPPGYRTESTARFAVRHTGPGGSYFGTGFAGSMTDARRLVSLHMRQSARFG